ncbi:MAG: Gfo/Idh/MocA family oxidoreductase [Gemmatimonadetes bacterium]|nr:Gfo/Idh/MocA family oxidoreductase [Gemmatimonadota bacterium]
MNKVRIVVVGAGQWGRNHVRTVASLPGAQLTAVCDLSDDRRKAMAHQYPGVLVSADLDAVLDVADGVVVATPVISHADVARAAMARGLPVLIEKPMALTVDDAEDLVRRVDAGEGPVVVGHLLVFHPAVEYLQRMVAGGELGSIFYLYSQRVNLGQVRPDENALWSFGPHDVSVALRLLGEEPARVSAHGRSYLQPGIEDVVFLTMELNSGVMVHVQMSWLDPHKVRRLTVVGSKKMVVFDDMQPREKIKVYDKGVGKPPTYGSYGESLAVREGDIVIPRIPNVEPLRAELAHFLAVVRGEEESRSSARDGLQVVRILDAATRSLRSGGDPVELGQVTTESS